MSGAYDVDVSLSAMPGRLIFAHGVAPREAAGVSSCSLTRDHPDQALLHRTLADRVLNHAVG